MKFEMYKDAAGEYRWRFKAANGAILCTGGQGYKAKADCKHGVELIQTDVKDKLKFESYADDKGGFRWRLKAANGQVIASSSESYKTEADRDKSIEMLKTNAAKAEVVEVEEKK